MTDPKDKDQKTKIPYEPPRLFDLGGGVAYAGAPCSPGGSPAGKCQAGTAVGTNDCTLGTAAGSTCKKGDSAVGSCKAGKSAIG
jgi:hypothetical protein